MKVTLALLILLALMMGGTALQCHVCKEVKRDGQTDDDESDACVDNDSYGTAVLQDCGELFDSCTTDSISYQLPTSGAMTQVEQKSFGCGSRPGEGDDPDATCSAFEALLSQTNPDFTDFACSSDYCSNDLCNCDPEFMTCEPEPDAGHAAHISLLLLAATIAHSGILFN